MKLKPNQERARLAIILLWIVLGIEAASLISSILQYSLLTDMNNDVFVSDEKMECLFGVRVVIS